MINMAWSCVFGNIEEWQRGNVIVGQIGEPTSENIRLVNPKTRGYLSFPLWKLKLITSHVISE